MALFRTDSLVLSYSNIDQAKRWWVDTFDCKPTNVPGDWDNPLPSDVALKFPSDSEPTILLCDKAEAALEKFDRSNPIASVIFSDKLKKAHEYLSNRAVTVGPIEDGGDMQLFEIRGIEGNLIQICKET
jgi:hypothetical protein